MHGDSRPCMQSQSVVSVNGSRRLLAITQAVNPVLQQQVADIDWMSRDWRPDDHYYPGAIFRRRVLLDQCELMQAIDTAIFQLIPDINRLCGTMYTTAVSVWHICESGFVCPMHTDGEKHNVMIMYWQTPGPAFGTTFTIHPIPRISIMNLPACLTPVFLPTMNRMWENRGPKCGTHRWHRYLWASTV